MIDIHCHILPGLDDGPDEMAEAVEMCRIAAADGIRTIVATPHFRPGTYQFSAEVTAKGIAALKSVIRREGIELAILQGADVTISPELPITLRSEKSLFINQGKYFLAELPHAVPPRWEIFLLSLLQQGFFPILTHPERNAWFLNNPQALYSFVAAGGLVQITAMSLIGECGEDVREFCELLLKHNLAHVIATDAHSTGQRPPLLSEAVRVAEDMIGAEKASALVTSIPAAIVDGGSALCPEPMAIIKKRTWIQRLLNV